MSKGWHEVARLGGTGARYPHVLVDSHGWCLRLGPNYRSDEKCYSSLPMLLRGLVEQSARRRLLGVSEIRGVEELCREVKDVLHTALALCHEVLAQGGWEEYRRRLEPTHGGSTGGDSTSDTVHRGAAGEDARGGLSRRRAV